LFIFHSSKGGFGGIADGQMPSDGKQITGAPQSVDRSPMPMRGRQASGKLDKQTRQPNRQPNRWVRT